MSDFDAEGIHPYRTPAVVRRPFTRWAYALAMLAEVLPFGRALALQRWYRRAIGGHWHRVEGLFLHGCPSFWERVDHCDAEQGRQRGSFVIFVHCEDWS